MNEIFNALTLLEKIFVVSAAVGGVLFLIQLVMQFIGGDTDAFGDMDGVGIDDLHASDLSFKLLSFQGLSAFFMMFGLVGIALSRQSSAGPVWALIGGLIAGLATVWVIGKIFSKMKGLQSSGTIDINNAVGQEGKVYLTIPAEGTGKIQIIVQSHLREYEAISEGEEEIKTGEQVKVVRIVSGNIMVVKKN